MLCNPVCCKSLFHRFSDILQFVASPLHWASIKILLFGGVSLVIVVLVVLCVASLAAAVLQTMRLRTLQQKMDALRQNVEHEVRKQEALWHDMVHDLRNPAACMYSLAQLIQENRNGDPEQLNHFLDEMHKSSSKVLQVMADQVPPPPDMRVVFGDAPAPSETDDTIEQKK